MADDARLLTADKRSRVSLSGLVEPGEQYMVFKDGDQIVLSPVVVVARTAANAEVLDRIANVDRVSGFLAEGIRRELPKRRGAGGAYLEALGDEQAAQDQQRDEQWSAFDRSEGGRG